MRDRRPRPEIHAVTVAGPRAARDVAASPPADPPRADPRRCPSAGWLSRTSGRSGSCSSTRSGQRDPFTSLVVREFTLDNFAELFTTDVYRVVTIRTVGMALLVTATCIVLAFPIAYYMARVASPRVRGMLVVAVVMPLWASYLIKAYSWRLILADDGVLDWLLEPLGLQRPGLRRRRGLARLHLPVAAVHDPADLRRASSGSRQSLLEASADLGGRGWMTFRRVILPLIVPGHRRRLDLHVLADPRRLHRPGPRLDDASSSATSSSSNVGAGTCRWRPPSPSCPLAIMLVYLFLVRRFGAFEAL